VEGNPPPAAPQNCLMRRIIYKQHTIYLVIIIYTVYYQGDVYP
jgi:hypothetical protein